MKHIEAVLHTGRTRAIGTREGHARSDDGCLDVRLTPPGAPGGGTNPEQLLAAAWSADFLSALHHAANAYRVAWPEHSSVDAEIDLVHGPQGFFLRARFSVSLPELDDDDARTLIEAAQRNGAYAKAMHGNVEVAITLA